MQKYNKWYTITQPLRTSRFEGPTNPKKSAIACDFCANKKSAELRPSWVCNFSSTITTIIFMDMDPRKVIIDPMEVVESEREIAMNLREVVFGPWVVVIGLRKIIMGHTKVLMGSRRRL